VDNQFALLARATFGDSSRLSDSVCARDALENTVKPRFILTSVEERGKSERCSEGCSDPLMSRFVKG